MCCGVIPILFGQFLRIPSLHVLVSLGKFSRDFFLLLFLYSFFRSSKSLRREAGKGKMHGV